MPRQKRDLWDKIWRDNKGQVVIWQTPNLPLIGWAVLTAISMFISNNKLANILALVGAFLLAIWALAEIIKGVNYFRRFLGVIVLFYTVLFMIKTF